MDRYPCVNRYKHGVDCPGWVNVHGARCEDCVVSFKASITNKAWPWLYDATNDPHLTKSASRDYRAVEIECDMDDHPRRRLLGFGLRCGRGYSQKDRATECWTAGFWVRTCRLYASSWEVGTRKLFGQLVAS
ncbi:hypothetical protein LY76DRAFT_61420 [Colletotrichum caudatum]|nr:hypothetical protein LY76DRAFT_61420 [Colletotrichum caudatum]